MSPTQPDFLSRLLNNLSLARRRSERLPRTRLNLETLEDRLAPAVAVFREGLDVGFGAYAGTQDVRLVENAADTNFGQDTLIWTDFASSSPSNTSQVLMRFDNIFGDAAVGQIPPNAVITSAQLLISTEGSSNSQGDGGSFHRMLVDWDESVTWNTASPNFPGAGAIPGFDATETFESQAGFPTLAPNIPVGRAAYDVTQDLRAWLNDASNVQSSGTPTLTFADANPDTITRDGGSWLSDGFAVGDRIRVIGTTNNNGTYVIAGVTATTITLDGNNTLTSEADVSGATVFEVTNRGWLMNPWENGTDGWGFQSSESTIPGSRPELRVEYFIPNPPNTDTVSFGSPVVAGLQEASPNSTGPGGTIVLGAGTTQQTLVRFDNLFVSQGGSIPDGANILGARLRATTQGDSFNFFFGSPEDPRAGSGAELFRLLQPFTAGSTWNSFTDGVQADGTEAVVSPDDSVGFNRGAGMIGSQQTVFFDVADTVRAWAEGETNHGFALLPFSNGTDDWQFLTSSLQLEVTYSTDIDPARFIVSSTGTAVNESGTPTVTVGVKLDRAPQANVTIPIASTNTAEGTVSVTELTFTPLDFATEQFFTVTGVDDSIVDGNRPFEVTFGPASSTDQNYNLRTADSLVITNTDDDTSGLAVLTFQQNVNNGFGVYTDVVDTNLSLNDPNIPQNNDTRLLIDAPSADSGLTEQALVRFNNIIGGAAGQLPAGSEVISATLTMTTTGGAGNGDGGSVHRILQDWAPDATYNSFGGGIQADDVEAASTFNAQAGSSLLNNDPADFQVVNMDVTRDVQAWADGASNFGWSILPWANGTNAWIAFSSEDAEPENRPTLTIEYVIPQPTTAVLEFRDGQDGYTGTADTQLLEGDATTPRGSDNGILVDFDPGSINGHGLVRFDDIIGNAANQIPVGSTVFSAELVLHTFNTGDGGTFHRMVSAWDEATATWDSFSGGIQADGSEAAVAFNSQAGNDTGSPNVPTQSGSYDVTADIQAWANGETNNGWAFLPYQDRTDGWEFYTSDFADLGARPLLRVTLSNRPPQADDDRFSVAQDSGANVLDVLNGDFDPDSDTFLITNVSTPTSNGGTVVIIGGGTGLTYEPASGFFGVDSFTYTIEDSNGSTATATVTVDVNATGNNAPVAVDDNYPVGGPAGTALEDTPFVVNAANGLITNDTDTDVTDVLTVNAFTQPTNGTVTVNPDGSFTYTPAQNFNGVDSFVYTLVDGRGG
ncbi:MAG: DNRLRE domain-containing protein, partial [Gemmataceae bacterium]